MSARERRKTRIWVEVYPTVEGDSAGVRYVHQRNRERESDALSELTHCSKGGRNERDSGG